MQAFKLQLYFQSKFLNSLILSSQPLRYIPSMNCKSFTIYICSLAISAILFSCGGDKKPGELGTPPSPNAAGVVETPNVEEAAEKALESIPNPTDIPALLERVDAPFMANLPNKPGKASKYSLSRTKAALNLGVYNTGLGYFAVYNKAGQASALLADIKNLSDEVSIPEAFDDKAASKIEKNLDNPDSLRLYSEKGIAKAQTILATKGEGGTAVLLASGIFTEGLYISTQIIANYPKNLPATTRDMVMIPLIKNILDQKTTLSNIIVVLQSLPNPDADTKSLIEQLSAIEKAYSSINIEDKLAKQQADLVVNDKTIAQLTSAVKSARDWIVN